MVLTHLDSRPGEVLVRLPDGSTQWVKVGDMIALANSDKEIQPRKIAEGEKLEAGTVPDGMKAEPIKAPTKTRKR